MDSLLAGLLGVLAVVLIAESVSTCLRRPLLLLLRAEKSGERSAFWIAYVRIVMLLVPAAFALLNFSSVLNQLRWGLVGLMIVLAIAGRTLRVPPPPRPHTAPFVPPFIPPTASGPAR